MKKITIGILISVLILSYATPSFCEDGRFSIRNGIMFGMSKDEVIEVESQNDDGEYEEREEDGIIKLTYDKDSVAGIDTGWILYSLADDGLTGVTYGWDYFWAKNGSRSHSKKIDPNNVSVTRIQCESEFHTLDEALSEKYELVGAMNTKDDSSLIDYNVLDLSIPERIKNTHYTDEYGEEYEYDLIGYREYLARGGDDYVVILLGSYGCTGSKYYYNEGWTTSICFYALRVDYKPVSRETIDGIMSSENEREEQRNNDL